MKSEKTYKEIKNSFPHCFQCPANKLDHLFSFKSAVGCHTSVYGWDCDFYDLFPVCIATGYRPRGFQNLNHDVVEKYDSLAYEILRSPLSCEDQKMIINELIQNFITEITTK